MSLAHGVLFSGYGLRVTPFATALNPRFSCRGSDPSVPLRTTRLLSSIQSHVTSHIERSRAAHSFSGAVPVTAAQNTRGVWQRNSVMFTEGQNVGLSRNPFWNPFGLSSYSGGPRHARHSSVTEHPIPEAAASARPAQGHTRVRSSIEMPFVMEPPGIAVQLNPVKESGHVCKSSVVAYADENEEAASVMNVRFMQHFQVRREVLEQHLAEGEGIIELCKPSEVEGNLKTRIAQLKKERLNLKSAIFNAQFTMKHAALNGQGKAFIAEKKRLIDLKRRFEGVTESLITVHRTLSHYQKLLAAPQVAELALREAERTRDGHLRSKADKSVIQGSRDAVQNKGKALRDARIELQNFYARREIQACRKAIFKAELDFLDGQMELDQAKIAPEEIRVFEKSMGGIKEKAVAAALAELKRLVTPNQFQLELGHFKQVDLEIEGRILKLEEKKLFAEVETIYTEWQSLPISYKIPRTRCLELFATYWIKYKEHLRAKTRVQLDQANLGGLQKSHPAAYAAILNDVKRGIFQQKVQYAQRLCVLCPGFFSPDYLAKKFNRPLDAIKAV